MSTKSSLAAMLLILLVFILGCRKEQSLEQVYSSQAVEIGEAKAPKWPRVKFKYHYDGMGNCGGGTCGSCIGVCVYAPLSLGFMPTSGELAQGIGRVGLKVIGSNVEFTPMDLPMDPGTGKVILDDVLETSAEVAAHLGYTKVDLASGTYTVDYSGGATYGRILVPATLVP